VDHPCNLSYLGGRDQKESNLRPGQVKKKEDTNTKYATQKRTGRVAQVIEPSKYDP
jgi:hypothetical protein